MIEIEKKRNNVVVPTQRVYLETKLKTRNKSELQKFEDFDINHLKPRFIHTNAGFSTIIFDGGHSMRQLERTLSAKYHTEICKCESLGYYIYSF